MANHFSFWCRPNCNPTGSRAKKRPPEYLSQKTILIYSIIALNNSFSKFVGEPIWSSRFAAFFFFFGPFSTKLKWLFQQNGRPMEKLWNGKKKVSFTTFRPLSAVHYSIFFLQTKASQVVDCIVGDDAKASPQRGFHERTKTTRPFNHACSSSHITIH